MDIIKLVILSLSALLLIFVGASRLLKPTKTYLNSSGIDLNNDRDLMNEMRGVGAVMLCAGVIVTLGIFLPDLSFSAHLVAALIFVGFAIGRFTGIAFDGKPNKKIMQGIVFEVILGGANVFAMGLI